MHQKILIYQLFPRLFGNRNTALIPYGSIEQNGSGKFSDISEKALESIADLGFTHIWYTGIPEHATATDYHTLGISPDNPAVVKGRAGSPYAIKDYYDVDPDLASHQEKRMDEFLQLMERTHKNGLKIIIDFVPNHVARNYFSDHLPEGHQQIGKYDDPSEAFLPDNNFYYFPGKRFIVPQEAIQQCAHYTDLLKIRPFYEYPAKASGNNCFTPSPSFNDWYETAKLNYGIDFRNTKETHFQPIPSLWKKMLDILNFWVELGVDGFRCDMAEMVPVEFWSWVIPKIKTSNKIVLFIAEIYNPAQYDTYIHCGKFDFLYDKVGLYDALRALTEGHGTVTAITAAWQQLGGNDHHMLRFMENHDEQRIASRFFAGDPFKGLPAMVVATLLHQGPVLVYNGQELGEPGDSHAGFSGDDGRTTIFDYWSMPAVQRWNNKGAFNEEALEEKEKALRRYYKALLQLCNTHPSIASGEFYDLLWLNPHLEKQRIYAFLRHTKNEILCVVASFLPALCNTSITIAPHACEACGIPEAKTLSMQQCFPPGKNNVSRITRNNSEFVLPVEIPPYGASVFLITRVK
ncbi:MAG: alpha-amylase [Bacteroidia bacterium]|nr:alpha-amylase [Bacteroidia bacterium]